MKGLVLAAATTSLPHRPTKILPSPGKPLLLPEPPWPWRHSHGPVRPSSTASPRTSSWFLCDDCSSLVVVQCCENCFQFPNSLADCSLCCVRCDGLPSLGRNLWRILLLRFGFSHWSPCCALLVAGGSLRLNGSAAFRFLPQQT